FKKPNHRLAITLETRLDPQKPEEDAVLTHFLSYSEYPMRFGDMEVHCLIDEKPLRLGSAERGDMAQLPGSAETLYLGIGLQNLEQLANGKKVEMRLGPVEWTLSNQSLMAIREFVNTARKQQEALKMKGKNNEE